jgi:ABC-2 type transport system permease protein
MLSAFVGEESGGLPIGPWQGLGVTFTWALGSLAVGYAFLRRRDA